jgi:hypothetical protein
MKFLFLFFLSILCLTAYTQTNSIVGKWKPISFSLGDMLNGDLTKNEPDIKISLDSLVKNDKDPEGSKEMMNMVFQMMFDKTKSLMEEYTTKGDYIETDTKTGKIKMGKYIFDKNKNELTKWYINSKNKIIYKLTWNENNLKLSSNLKTVGEKPSEFIVIYNKL